MRRIHSLRHLIMAWIFNNTFGVGPMRQLDFPNKLRLPKIMLELRGGLHCGPRAMTKKIKSFSWSQLLAKSHDHEISKMDF